MATSSQLLSNLEILPKVGRVSANRFRDAGASNLAELIAGGPSIAAAAGGSAKLAALKATAYLMTLDGMTAPVAAALVEEGMTSIGRLADVTLRTVERAVRDLPATPSLYDLAGWQQQACRRRGTGLLAIVVTTLESQAMPGALVRVGGQSQRTNELGWAAFDAIDVGTQRVEVTHEKAQVPFGFSAHVTNGSLFGPVRLKIPEARKSQLASTRQRQSEGSLVSNRGIQSTRVETVSLQSFSDGAYFIVRPALQSGDTPLVSLDKIRAGFDLIIQRVVVEAGELPTGIAAGDVVQLTNGRLEPSNLTPVQITRAWWKPVVRTIRRISI